MIDAIRKLVSDVVKRLSGLEWLAKVFVRLSVGVMFAGGAIGKLMHLDRLVAYFTQLGIPAPGIQAPFVASMELLCGSLLIVGLATRGAAAVITVLMLVATFSARLKEEHVHRLIDFLYLNEWLLILIAVWFIFSGAGKASLDQMIARRLEAQPDVAKG